MRAREGWAAVGQRLGEQRLAADPLDNHDAMRLLAPAETPEWEAYPVATFVNSPRNDGPELMARIAKPPPQFLF